MGANLWRKIGVGVSALLLAVYAVNSVWNLVEIFRGPKKIEQVSVLSTEKVVADTVISAMILGDSAKALPLFEEKFAPKEKIEPVFNQIHDFLKNGNGFVRGYFPFEEKVVPADPAKGIPEYKEINYFVEKSDNSKLAVSMGLRPLQDGSLRVIALWARSMDPSYFAFGSRVGDFIWGFVCLLLFMFTSVTAVMVLRSKLRKKWLKVLLIFLNGGIALITVPTTGVWGIHFLVNTNTYFATRASAFGAASIFILLPIGTLILQGLLAKNRVHTASPSPT